MKKSIRKIFALVLTFVIIFSISVVPVSAKNIYEKNNFMGLIEVYDYGNEEDKTFFEKIKDTFHWYIARLFAYFDGDCPVCGEHFAVPYLDDSVENYYNKAVNDLKIYKGLVTIKKTRTVNIEVKDTPKVVQSIIDPIAESLTGTTTETYIFLNGKNTEGRKITDVIQPLGRNAEMTNDAVSDNSLRFSSDEGQAMVTALTISLAAENSIFDGTVLQNPPYNSSVIDPINPAALDLGPLKIITAEISYPETLVAASFDDNLRATSIKIDIPINAFFTGNASVIRFSANCEARITEEYTITYA
jgi:hypothetical protein